MDETYLIREEEMHFFNLISIDEVGEVFEWRGKILRGITEEARPLVDRYFSSGFLDTLVEKGYFPKTEISHYTNPKYCYILEHERIELQTIDAEWSFDMLKDAALLVCEIAAIAWSYGFNMKDCHTKNVLFKNNKPVYVDLGSFVEIEEGTSGFKSYDQIQSYYYYVLQLWSDGFISLPKQLQCLYRFEKRDYLLYKYPVFRYLNRILQAYLSIEGTLFLLTTSTFESTIVKKSKCRIVLWKLLNKTKPFKWQRPNIFFKKLKKIQRPQLLSVEFPTNLRFEFNENVVQMLDSYKDYLVVNPMQFGFLDSMLEKMGNKHIITVDYNECKGNVNYLKYRNKGIPLTNLSFNMSYPVVHYNYQTPPQNRIKASAFIVIGARDIVTEQNKPLEVLYKTLLDYDFNSLVVVELRENSCTGDEEHNIGIWYSLEKTEYNGEFVITVYKKK